MVTILLLHNIWDSLKTKFVCFSIIVHNKMNYYSKNRMTYGKTDPISTAEVTNKWITFSVDEVMINFTITCTSI